MALWFRPLEDGNAGEEAEELIPGPNFCVLMVVHEKKKSGPLTIY